MFFYINFDNLFTLHTSSINCCYRYLASYEGLTTHAANSITSILPYLLFILSCSLTTHPYIAHHCHRYLQAEYSLSNIHHRPHTVRVFYHPSTPPSSPILPYTDANANFTASPAIDYIFDTACSYYKLLTITTATQLLAVITAPITTTTTSDLSLPTIVLHLSSPDYLFFRTTATAIIF